MAPDGRQPFPLLCSSCHRPLATEQCNNAESFRCPHCSVQLQVELFPAMLRALNEQGTLGAVAGDGEASCFYHPDKQAATVCSSCGRFLCSLCEIELGGQYLCPVCFEQGRQSEQIASLVTKRVLHDSIALSIALVPLLIWPVTLITAPIAFSLAIYAWRKPTSILRRTKLRLLAALFFSGVQIVGWGVLAVVLLQKWIS